MILIRMNLKRKKVFIYPCTISVYFIYVHVSCRIVCFLTPILCSEEATRGRHWYVHCCLLFIFYVSACCTFACVFFFHPEILGFLYCVTCYCSLFRLLFLLSLLVHISKIFTSIAIICYLSLCGCFYLF